MYCAALRPVKRVACPVALWGSPSTPRQASIGFELCSIKSHRKGQTSAFTGLSGEAGARPNPSTNMKICLISQLMKHNADFPFAQEKTDYARVN